MVLSLNSKIKKLIRWKQKTNEGGEGGGGEERNSLAGEGNSLITRELFVLLHKTLSLRHTAKIQNKSAVTVTPILI